MDKMESYLFHFIEQIQLVWKRLGWFFTLFCTKQDNENKGQYGLQHHKDSTFLSGLQKAHYLMPGCAFYSIVRNAEHVVLYIWFLFLNSFSKSDMKIKHQDMFPLQKDIKNKYLSNMEIGIPYKIIISQQTNLYSLHVYVCRHIYISCCDCLGNHSTRLKV